MSTTHNNGESFDKDFHLNDLIEKPWGYEYRVYCDCVFDLWKLHIDANQSTSMHCHIQKDTVLICLSGSGYTKFLDGTIHQLNKGDSVYIERGVFHQTIASENQGLQLIEIENPRNKFDLLRLNDSYGRKNTAYEQNSVSHDLLAPIKNIGPGSFIRSEDLHKNFKYKLANLSEEDLSDENFIFMVGVSIDHHLSGKINVLNKEDITIKNYLGQKTLLISKF
nr:cupin domain-containing protein [Rouxiella badensis]